MHSRDQLVNPLLVMQSLAAPACIPLYRLHCVEQRSVNCCGTLLQAIGASSYSSTASLSPGMPDSSHHGSFSWPLVPTSGAGLRPPSGIGGWPGTSSLSGTALPPALSASQQRLQQAVQNRTSTSNQHSLLSPLLGPTLATGVVASSGGSSAGAGMGSAAGGSMGAPRRQPSNLSLVSRQGSSSPRPSSPLLAGPSATFLAAGSSNPMGSRSRANSFIGPGGLSSPGGQVLGFVSGLPAEMQPSIAAGPMGWNKSATGSSLQVDNQPIDMQQLPAKPFAGLDVLGRPLPMDSSISAASTAAAAPGACLVAVSGTTLAPATTTGTANLKGLLSPRGGSSKGLKVKFTVESRAPVTRTRSYVELHEAAHPEVQQQQQQHLQLQEGHSLVGPVNSQPSPKRAAGRTYSKTRLCAGVSWKDLSEDGLIKVGACDPAP